MGIIRWIYVGLSSVIAGFLVFLGKGSEEIKEDERLRRMHNKILRDALLIKSKNPNQ